MRSQNTLLFKPEAVVKPKEKFISWRTDKRIPRHELKIPHTDSDVCDLDWISEQSWELESVNWTWVAKFTTSWSL